MHARMQNIEWTLYYKKGDIVVPLTGIGILRTILGINLVTFIYRKYGKTAMNPKLPLNPRCFVQQLSVIDAYCVGMLSRYSS